MTAAVINHTERPLSKPRAFDEGTSIATLVNTSLTHTIDVNGLSRLNVQLTVAVAALTGFSIAMIPNNNGSASVLYSAAADFTLPKGLLLGASGDLTTQAVGGGWFIMDVAGFDSVVLTETSGGTATVSIAYGGV